MVLISLPSIIVQIGDIVVTNIRPLSARKNQTYNYHGCHPQNELFFCSVSKDYLKQRVRDMTADTRVKIFDLKKVSHADVLMTSNKLTLLRDAEDNVLQPSFGWSSSLAVARYVCVVILMTTFMAFPQRWKTFRMTIMTAMTRSLFSYHGFL